MSVRVARRAGTKEGTVTDIIDDAKDTWDGNNVEGESSAEKIVRLGAKPTDITLP